VALCHEFPCKLALGSLFPGVIVSCWLKQMIGTSRKHSCRINVSHMPILTGPFDPTIMKEGYNHESCLLEGAAFLKSCNVIHLNVNNSLSAHLAEKTSEVGK
jgi:hypothetical protein